jgi:type III secretory pathway component EscV
MNELANALLAFFVGGKIVVGVACIAIVGVIGYIVWKKSQK